MEKESSLKWCYIGENQEYVIMTCTKEDWETIRTAVEWAAYKKRSEELAQESDAWNYGYTRENR